MSKKPRLLFVDDEPQLLQSIKLSVRKQYRVTTAESGREALALFEAAGDDKPFDAVVSDMRMPEMTGARLLTTLRDRYPDIPRLLLSGQSDFESALEAINDAKIFRFLTKPCPPELLIESIDEALEQTRLRTAERELLDQTLSGTVSMLTDVLGLVSSGAYSRTMRLRETVTGVCTAIGRPVAWDLSLATMLSQIGFVVLPHGEDGSVDLDNKHVEIAAQLLSKIPRLESVADMVGHQLDAQPSLDSSDPADWTDEYLNTEILRLAVSFDALIAEGVSRTSAHTALQASTNPPPPFLLDALRSFNPDDSPMIEVSTTVDQLAAGMKLMANIHSTGGPKLVGADTVLTSALVERIRAFARGNGVVEPISVLVPASSVSKLN